MKEFGLERGKDGLQVYVMCEIPANVILAKEFSEIFDGFSIGSNDLTQLTLGVDRDSALVSHVYDEKNEAVKTLIRQVIRVAHENKRKVGICGQAPSDYPEFAEFLVQEGIDSISLNPDTVLKTRERIAAMEKKVAAKPAGSFKMGVASKLLLIFGVFGLATVLGGYTCQTVNTNKVSVEQMQAEVATKVAAAKLEVKQEMEQVFAKEKSQELAAYTENEFANFTVSYPSSWSILRSKDGVFLGSTDPVASFSVEKKDIKDVVKFSVQSTSTWNGYAVKFFTYSPTADNQTGVDLAAQEYQKPSKIAEVYPSGFEKSKYVIMFMGDAENFDKIFQTITFLKLN